MQILHLLFTQANQSAGGSLFGLMVPLLVIFGVFYIFIIIPQQRTEKKRQAMLASLKKGDRVITIGGIIGTVNKVDDKFVILKVSQETNIKFDKSAVKGIIEKAE